MAKRIAVFFVIAGILALWTIVPIVQAEAVSQPYTIQQIKGVPIKNDFVVSPGKTEMIINPGETSVKNVTVVNRFDQQMKFSITVEDFAASDKPEDIIKFLGDEKGPYSLKDYIRPAVSEVVLQSGDRANIPVYITVPADAQPGGLYGAVLVSYKTTDPLEQARLDAAEVAGGLGFTSRIAVLFFIRVPGPVNQQGSVTGFAPGKYWYRNGPINLSWQYKNSGTIYNTPYGVIQINNLYGTTVDQIAVDPYYVMPSSTRSMSKTWDHGFMLGRYKATLRLNLGYGNNIIAKTTTFWVMPWKILALIFGGLFAILIIIFAIRAWFKKNYEKKDKKKPADNQA